ncbi:hypothetical protein CH279_21665 [Rhodococcus sp. 06-412-2B]|uniref:NBR1-Ig-like domain-containing protein n=1 Tax=unclassified Rhodococcus (in: high G+C Gram-positive bacteria) TaxID=192944 RepID=UPI000B9A2DCC|nr:MULTISPECIES: NBR1-Ig-like domain-containing protein [unclassified Rhodococcus (in: high G+C Gram-positive bacteria)]OZC94065.1 hypothetical protein CH279_21665 [Rhodococcus sp. 06-412-2B]
MDEGKSTRGRGRPPKKLDPPTDALGRFANHVRSGRAIAGLKQTELAERLGCTPGTLSQIERGILRPSPALATALDQALGWNGLLLSLFRDAQEEKDRKTADRIGRSHDPQTGALSTEPTPADLHLEPGDVSLWVADITIPDGTLMAPGERFTKIWRVRNGGSVHWKGRYIKRMGPLGGSSQVATLSLTPIPDTAPGELCDIAVECKAHVLPGSSQANFKMSDAHGRLYYPNTTPEGVLLAITVVEGLTPRSADDGSRDVRGL